MQKAATADLGRVLGVPQGSTHPGPLGSPPRDAGSCREQMDYVADMLLQLKGLAEGAGKSGLGLLLELAAREARAN
jgi:hypothetical protein